MERAKNSVVDSEEIAELIKAAKEATAAAKEAANSNDSCKIMCTIM